MAFFEKALESWQSMTKALVFFTASLLILTIFILIISENLNLDEVSVSSADGITLSFGSSETLNSILVHPRGWQSSGIRVKKGEELRTEASGSINIAMGRMVKSLAAQYNFKEKYEKLSRGRSLDNFSTEELQASLFAYPWNGPEGVQLNKLTDQSAVNRIINLQESRVFQRAQVGQLLIVVAEDSEKIPEIAKSQVIPYRGPNSRTIVNKDGFLWFIVNDEKIRGDKRKDLIIWQDNLGMFSVKVLRKRL